MIAPFALIAAAGMQAATRPAPVVGPPPCTARLCDAERLRPFLDKLATARSGTRPVRIVQIGDSHTAGDQITGSWRTLLQSRHGFGGRGTLPPGRPYAGYLTRGVTVSQSDGWRVDGIFGAAYRPVGAAPIGLSGYSFTNIRPGASMTVRADDATQRFDRLTLCALRGTGSVRMTLGTTVEDWSLADTAGAAGCRTIAAPYPVDTASVGVTDGAVTLTSWATERSGTGGVIFSNLGTVGAQFVHFDRTDDAVVAAELATYAPDLIVVAFGTNEAFRPGFSATSYDATLRADLGRLRRLAPGVPILMLGAPDTATRNASLQSGEGGISPPCITAPVAAPVVQPGEVVQPVPRVVDSGWRPTAALAAVQSIQRRRAHELGIAYWDWSAAMGGRCTAHGWASAAVPLMRGDHVHFTSRGAAEIATRLQADIDAAPVQGGDASPDAVPVFVRNPRPR